MARLPRFGRSDRDVKIMPDIYPVVGRTEAEALEIRVSAIADQSQCWPRAAGTHDRCVQPGAISAAWSGAGDGRDERPFVAPAPAARSRVAGQAEFVRTVSAECGTARACADDRHARSDRGRDGALVSERRGGWLQRHAYRPAGITDRFCGHGHPRTATAWSVPYRMARSDRGAMTIFQALGASRTYTPR
jgi:alkanesulfonate monooxygenase SsuD/methylene tetrahydromethanopterin reductase-like flavin-dependent oxidoreductase (luciferase family)